MHGNLGVNALEWATTALRTPGPPGPPQDRAGHGVPEDTGVFTSAVTDVEGAIAALIGR